jgi:nitrous oxidase accessory protein
MRFLNKIIRTLFIFPLILTLVINAKVLNIGKDHKFKNIQNALSFSKNGDTVMVLGGTYYGNFIISKSIFFCGKNNPVFDGKNTGTVLTITAPNVKVDGIVVKNSGILLDKEDAGILVKSDSTVITNNVLKSVLFGVYFLKVNNGIMENNLVEGKKELDIPRKGDLFRAWYCKNLFIKNNQFRYGRDVIIWFSQNINIEDNNMSGARYGLHFMYNSDCRIIHNIMTGNSVGMYLMYSQKIFVSNNLIANNSGASGFGIGLKDLDNVELNNNVVANNRVGVFVDNSPRSYNAFIRYNGNAIAYNETGMEFMSSLENSYLVKNSFIENYLQVQLSNYQNPDNDYWKGNYWSDYSGYDKDRDGIGDIPYKYDELVENLIGDKPNLKFFLYSPAINTLNYASQAFPILQPEPRLIDKTPITKPIMPKRVPVLKIQKETGFIVLSLTLTVLSIVLILVFISKNKLVHPACGIS